MWNKECDGNQSAGCIVQHVHRVQRDTKCKIDDIMAYGSRTHWPLSPDWLSQLVSFPVCTQHLVQGLNKLTAT